MDTLHGKLSVVMFIKTGENRHKKVTLMTIYCQYGHCKGLLETFKANNARLVNNTDIEAQFTHTAHIE